MTTPKTSLQLLCGDIKDRADAGQVPKAGLCTLSQFPRLPPRGTKTEPRAGHMEELVRTNDLVLISFIEALLRDGGIEALVVDQNMSVIEGSLGVLPRRVLVSGEDLDRAREILESAGVGAELEKPSRSS
ncbi:MAG: putative signal transducing protein [Alphaproteobacteria bacterium]